jgi:hypothetical protein
MTCQDCRHFLTSEKAAQRAVLPGFGYCQADPSPMLRARFFRGDVNVCWQTPPRYEERPA